MQFVELPRKPLLQRLRDVDGQCRKLDSVTVYPSIPRYGDDSASMKETIIEFF